mgnify:CR=1 FL=1
MEDEIIGEHTKSLVTDIPLDPKSDTYKFYRKTIPHYEGEAVYIYSFIEGRMLYARGWKDILGYKDTEVTMLKIISATTPHFINFSNELNDKALKFISTKTKKLEGYSFTLEVKKIHKNGKTKVPLFSRVGVFKSYKGQMTEILGRSQIMKSVKYSKVMEFAAYGPDKSEFEESLSKELFNYLTISRREKEVLLLASKGMTFKEIGENLGVTQSAIEKRIIPLYKRFDVRSLPHLISFAYENHIL